MWPETLPSEFLHVGTWQELALEFNLLWWNGYEVDQLFGGPPRDKTVLVTACYDAAPTYQAEEHPNADLQKFIPVVDWGSLSEERATYRPVQIASWRNGRCHPRHRFSMKTDRYTWGTFQEIPDWVTAWYTTNANIDDERVHLLPFGLNNDGPGSSYLPEYMGRPKTDLLYVNFQYNSQRRLDLHRICRTWPWATYRPQPNLPVRTYFEELSSHKFCLCPRGNGLDAYRVWESLYLGVVPILEESRWAKKLLQTGLPVVVVSDAMGLTPGALLELYEEMRKHTWSLSWATLSWWRREFARVASPSPSVPSISTP